MFKRALHTAAAPRAAALGVAQDPWAAYQLCPGASEADKAAYSALRAEITEKAAFPALAELANQKWWAQQTALTYDADRNSRLLSLLRNAVPHHKKTMDAAVVAFQIDQLLAPLVARRPRSPLTAEEQARLEALTQIKNNPSLVTPKMLEDAYAAYAAHQAAEAQKKKDAAEKKLREQNELASRAAAQISKIQLNGW